MDSQKQVFDRLNFPRTTLEKLTRVFRIGTARMQGASRQWKSLSPPGIAVRRTASLPLAYARWSMLNGRMQFGPMSVLRSSMDRRVKRSDDESVVTRRGGITVKRRPQTTRSFPGGLMLEEWLTRPLLVRLHLIYAVRPPGVVPFLHRQTLPPAPHLLRRRSGSVPARALVPEDGAAQNAVAKDAVAGMGPARSAQVAAMPWAQAGAAAAVAPGHPIRHLRAV